MPSTLASVRHLAYETIVGWFEDSAPRHGAAIAYYTLFALAPVLLVVIGIAGLVFGEDAVRGEIVGQLAGLLGRDGAGAIQAILQRASEPREGIAATVAGVAGLLIATTGAFLELQAALNHIWRVAPASGPAIDVKRLLVRRVRSLGVVVAIGFLLMVSLSVNAALGAAASWWGKLTPGWPLALAVVNSAVGILVSTALFSVLYRVLPDVELRWRDVAVGAFVTAVLFAVGQRLIGLYLGQSAIATPFGAAGTVAIVLVWVYYASQIILLGAVFTRVYAEWRNAKPPLMPGTVPRNAATP
ncbi:MAG: YihY/virulence factor BrkB family protein [Gemmatimonadota bacterium]